MWNRIRNIKGKESTNYILYLSVNDRDVTSCRDIANALADNFSHNCSSAFSTDTFTYVRCKAENNNINVSSENVEVYNIPFSSEELQDALRRAHDTSAGPDEIHYQLLKQLPDASLLLLLNIVNQIWISGNLVGGKLFSSLFQSQVRIQLILLVTALLLGQVASVRPWNE